MKLTSLLSGMKVERHLLLLFVLCGVIPIGALALLSAPETNLGAGADFQIPYDSAALLSLCLVTLLFIRRIHQRLAPLEQLREEAQRIAGDSNVRVTVQSGDEFEEIATSFNAVATRLTEQFDTLLTMIEIGRMIHSSIDMNGIVNTVVARIRDIFPCDVVAVSLLKSGGSSTLQTFVAPDGLIASERIEATALGVEAARRLRAEPEHFFVDMDDGFPPYLEPFSRRGIAKTLVLPLLVRNELLGLIAIGRRNAWTRDRESVVFVRQLADQVAIALGNASTLETNRILAFYDPLTGLPNRRMYQQRLQQVLAQARRRGDLLATCYLDIDGFKRVNDTLGHSGGDRLLHEIGKRLVTSVRFSDAVARSNGIGNGNGSGEEPISRLGGDEFTVLLTDISDVQDAARVARRVQGGLSKPFYIDGHELFATASIGIAVYPFDGDDAETLLRNADTAMYCAKSRGRDNFQFYAKSMNAEASREVHLESRLRRAFERGEFEVHYQPLRDAASGKLNGAEALLRWDDPEMGNVSPGEFIPIAEKTGFIYTLGEWVLRSATAQCREWQVAGYRAIRIAVNLSGYQLRREEIVETVAQSLRETGLSPDHLELEITESTIMQDDAITTAALSNLHDMGVRIALDDFGTGYSSLSYLRRFALDRVKIDRSFVKDIPGNPDDRALSAAIIAMAHSLGLKVVAEGVETLEQAEFLRESGCDELQGFLFSPAVPAPEFSRFLEAEKQE
ncbi:MAG: EAL domain-containing protein [Myxococcales bacterium]|nr:EAL domain-containing protein [Myxococcales bacterium]